MKIDLKNMINKTDNVKDINHLINSENKTNFNEGSPVRDITHNDTRLLIREDNR